MKVPFSTRDHTFAERLQKTFKDLQNVHRQAHKLMKM